MDAEPEKNKSQEVSKEKEEGFFVRCPATKECLSDKEISQILSILHYVFEDIRHIAAQGKDSPNGELTQEKALDAIWAIADAAHNVPGFMARKHANGYLGYEISRLYEVLSRVFEDIKIGPFHLIAGFSPNYPDRETVVDANGKMAFR